MRAVSRAELREIFPVRAALEALAARLAAAAAQDGDVDALERSSSEMDEAARADDLHAQVAARRAFHRTIVEAAGNAICSTSGSLRSRRGR